MTSPVRAASTGPGNRPESSRYGEPDAAKSLLAAAAPRASFWPPPCVSPLDRTSAGAYGGLAVASGPAALFFCRKRRSPPGRRSGGDRALGADRAMSPAGRVPGSRPIPHGCSTRDLRAGSPLPPFATTASVRRSVVDAPSAPVCRVTAHLHSRPEHPAQPWAVCPESTRSEVRRSRAPAEDRSTRLQIPCSETDKSRRTAG